MEDHQVDEKTKHASVRFLNKQWNNLSAMERRVVLAIVERRHVSHDVVKEADDDRTFGERIADKVAAFGGSWTFIISFGIVLICWVVLNSFILIRSHNDFDPYPYILLNLFLSMIASIQAPVIMMSQNRQAAKDRLDAAHDYEVNLKSELEILGVHEKLDDLRDKKWMALIDMQQQQITLLEELLRGGKSKA